MSKKRGQVSKAPRPQSSIRTTSDWANLAQIVSVPLAVFCWFVTRDEALRFWKRWSWLIFLVLLCVGFFRVWRLGFFSRIARAVKLAVNTVQQCERRFALSVIGFLMGLAGMFFAVYTTFLANPKLSVELVGMADIIDTEGAGRTALSYRGATLDSNQSLTMVLVKFSNDGNVALSKSAYVEDSPVGVQFEEGKIIESSLVSTSSHYLANELRFVNTTNRITFSPVILNPRDSFLLRLIVARPSNTNLAFRTTGRIENSGVTDNFSQPKIHYRPPFSGGRPHPPPM